MRLGDARFWIGVACLPVGVQIMLASHHYIGGTVIIVGVLLIASSVIPTMREERAKRDRDIRLIASASAGHQAYLNDLGEVKSEMDRIKIHHDEALRLRNEGNAS